MVAAVQKVEPELSTGSARRSWSLLVVVCLAQFMVIIDATVVNVALPSIGTSLRFSTAADLQWVVTVYLLVTGGLTLLGGRMTDLLNRRRLFLFGLLLFTSASLATGLSVSPAAIVVSRAAQGLGAALLTPAALSILSTNYTGARRSAALAVWGAMGAGGAALGVLIGGILTSWIGWQWVFFINVPIGLVAFLLGLSLVPRSIGQGGRLRDLDLAGGAALIAGLVVLVFGIERVASLGWGSALALALFASAGLLLAGFVGIETRARAALIPTATWRRRPLVSGAFVMMGASAVMGGVFVLSSLYLQRVLGASAWQAGLAFLPMVASVGLAAFLGSRVVAHAGALPLLVVGLLVAAGGALLLARVPAEAGYFADVLPGLVSVGLGLGLVFVGVPITAMSQVDGDDGLASGLMQTAHEIGISLGVAVLAGVASSSAAGAGGFTTGYRGALLVAALLGAAVAVAAAVAVPNVRPAGASRPRLHGG